MNLLADGLWADEFGAQVLSALLALKGREIKLRALGAPVENLFWMIAVNRGANR